MTPLTASLLGLELLLLFLLWRAGLLSRWLGQRRPQDDEAGPFTRLLAQAALALELGPGWRATGPGVAAVLVGTAVGAGEVAGVWMDDWASGIAVGLLVVFLGAGIVGYLALVSYPRLFRRRFADQVEEAFNIIGDELKAGHSIEAALARVVAQMDWPLKEEFREALLYLAASAGLEPLEDVVAGVAGKPAYESEDLHLVAIAISILRPLGGDLGELSHQMSRLIRKRKNTERQIDILLTRGRNQARTLLIFAVFLNLAVLSFQYFSAQLWGTVIGRIAVSISMLMLAVGAFLVARLMRTEV